MSDLLERIRQREFSSMLFGLVPEIISEITSLRAELSEARRDAERIDWMEKNKVGIYAVQSSVRAESTATTGPRYFKLWKFCGWSASNRDDEVPTIREAIDAAMAAGGGK